MKPIAPEVVRKGSVVRVSGYADTAGASTVVLSYVDLRYDDGHVERWIGPGSMRDLPEGRDATRTLVAWGEAEIEKQYGCLVEELAMDFREVSEQAFIDAPVEVVVEWNVELNLPAGFPADP